jgi:hypothetical protein
VQRVPGCVGAELLPLVHVVDDLEGRWRGDLPAVHVPEDHVLADEIVHVLAAAALHQWLQALESRVDAHHAPQRRLQLVVVQCDGEHGESLEEVEKVVQVLDEKVRIHCRDDRGRVVTHHREEAVCRQRVQLGARLHAQAVDPRAEALARQEQDGRAVEPALDRRLMEL